MVINLMLMMGIAVMFIGASIIFESFEIKLIDEEQEKEED